MKNGPDTHINAYVLAGGKSRRMGHDKGLMLFNGKPMIVHLLELANELVTGVYISANNSKYEALGFPLIHDEIEGIGPIGGIRTCLKRSDSQLNLVMACDIPYISKNLLQYLIHAISRGYDLIIPYFHGTESQPLCAIYHKNMLEIIDKQIADRNYKLKNLIPKSRAKKLIIDDTLDFYHPMIFNNLNELDDMERLRNEEWPSK